jgi:regulatory protein
LVLHRRAMRDAAALDLPQEPVAEAIEALLDDLERLGLLDDAAFALGRARSLAAKGRPPRRIARELAAKGVSRTLIDDALHRLAAERGETQAALELDAAVAFARRRRLGPFGPSGEAAKPREKALAAFARAGFTLEAARRVLDAPPAELDQVSDTDRN